MPDRLQEEVTYGLTISVKHPGLLDLLHDKYVLGAFNLPLQGLSFENETNIRVPSNNLSHDGFASCTS